MESLLRQSQKILHGLRDLARREEGLVTVEWVALTAAMVIAAVVISFTVMKNTASQGNLVGNNVVGTVNTIYGTTGGNLNP